MIKIIKVLFKLNKKTNEISFLKMVKHLSLFAIHSEVSSCPWNKGHRLLQVGIQGKSIELGSAKPNHLTFLIDVSGSMMDADKLPLLKDALAMLVRQMRPVDRVGLVVYAGNAGLVLPSTSGDQKEKILQAIEALSAGGSTAGGEGIMLAYDVARQNFSDGAWFWYRQLPGC